MAQPSSENKSFCSMLWKHICVRPNFTHVPCCRFRGQPDSQSVNDNNSHLDFNSEYFQGIRKAMLAGEFIRGCEECYDEEAITRESLRLKSNVEYGTNYSLNTKVSPELIEYIEIFVGSTCNLMCVGCSPALSSSIRQEYVDNNLDLPVIFNSPTEMKIDFIEKLVNLKHIKFVGGEPLLNKLHDSIIAIIRKRRMSDMRLTYYTNCTIWPNPDTIETWKEAKHIDLTMSIDGFGPRNEYLRRNSRWEKVDRIANQYFALAEKLPRLTLQVNVTVSILNALYLQEIEDWFANLAAKYPNANFEPVYMTYLTDPPSLAAHNGPIEFIYEAIRTNLSSSSQQQWKIANLLKTVNYAENSEGRENFLTYVGRLDKIRKTSFRETFPELEMFFRD